MSCLLCGYDKVGYCEKDHSNRRFCNRECQIVHYIGNGADKRKRDNDPNYYQFPDKFPKEIIIQIMLNMDINQLGRICATNSLVAGLCNEEWFKRQYVLKHPEKMRAFLEPDMKMTANATSSRKLEKWLPVAILTGVLDLTIKNHFPFMWAVINGHLELVHYMVSIGVDPTIYNNLPVRYASQYGQLDIVKYLVSLRGVDPTQFENSAFRSSMKKGHLDVATYLLSLPNVRRLVSQRDLNIYNAKIPIEK